METEIATWLRSIGLETYVAAFRAHHVDMTILRGLTADDLAGLGVTSIGHRRRMLEALAALQEADKSALGHGTQGRSSGRRLITALFCDVVGSTLLAERLDPEDLHAVLTKYQAGVAGAISSARGTVNHFLGDGVLGCFGWLHPDEAHAESAVRAAFAILDALASQALPVRIGIATGLVVTDSLPGPGLKQSASVVGQTLNLAARLQNLAKPDTVVVSDGTRAHLGDICSLTDLGMNEIKGFDIPQRAWRVGRPTAVSSRSEALHIRRPVKLIGREGELATLLECWKQAVTGTAQTLMLRGDPGIGKSRLLAEFHQRLAANSHHILRYFCSQHAGDSPLFPVIAGWQRDAGFAPDDPAEVRLEKLEAIAGGGLAPNELGSLATLLSLPLPSHYPPLDRSAGRIRQRTFSALIRQIEWLSEDRPVILLFEDAHWADPSSLDLLRYGRERLAARPLLLVISYRPDFTPPWTGLPNTTVLTLGRLDQRDSEALALQMTDQSYVSPLLMTRILEAADGVPLFIEELAKTLLGGAGRVDQETALPVPQTLQALLMARLDHTPLARQVAQTAAVVGREFTRALLDVLARPGEPQLTAGLASLVGTGLAVQRSDTAEAPYVFKHALVQEVAYQSLLRTERRELHARLATVLEGNQPDSEASRPEILALHWTNAGEVAKAVDAWTTAARRSLGRAAVVEAASQITKGLRLLTLLPETAERWAPELELELFLAGTCMLTRGFGAVETGEACARARQLWERLGRPVLAAGAVFYGAWFVSLMRAEFGAALRLADELSAFAAEQDSRALQAMATHQQTSIHLSLGNFLVTERLCERALVLDDPSHIASYGIYQAQRSAAFMRTYRSRTLAYLGYFRQAAAEVEAAVNEDRTSGTALTLAWTLCQACFAEWALCLTPTILQRSEELLVLSKAQGMPQFLDAAYAGCGWCMIVLGRTEEGLSALARSSSFLDWGTRLFEPFRLLLLADAYRRVGDSHRGRAFAEQAVALIEVTSERWIEAEVLRVHGELLVLSGDLGNGERSIEAAIAVARRQESKAWELRSTISLARLWRDAGRLSEAQALLRPITEWFSDGFETSDLKEASVLLNGR